MVSSGRVRFRAEGRTPFALNRFARQSDDASRSVNAASPVNLAATSQDVVIQTTRTRRSPLQRELSRLQTTGQRFIDVFPDACNGYFRRMPRTGLSVIRLIWRGTSAQNLSFTNSSRFCLQPRYRSVVRSDVPQGAIGCVRSRGRGVSRHHGRGLIQFPANRRGARCV
jgi:hypothetical protein